MAACVLAPAFAQEGPPFFQVEDVRPHGAAAPYPLTPGLLTWIFGSRLARHPGCGVRNMMDPATYETELCGTRVLVGGIAARLVMVSDRQINLVLPDHPWENEMVGVQVIRDGHASAVVPVSFGFNRPVVSAAGPAFAGMPVWIRVEKPWGKGWLRYPFHTEPWDFGPATIEVRFEGRELKMLPLPYWAPSIGGGVIGLPREVPREYLHRLPLHLMYPLERAGTYHLRYTEYRYRGPGTSAVQVYQQSDWTPIEVRTSTAEQRRAWFQGLAGQAPEDIAELLSNYLPSLLAARHEPALRILARYLDHREALVRSYSGYALNYFDPALLRRVAPGRKPLRGGVR
jgi:hypothetical protein